MSTSSLRRQMKNIVHNYSEAEIKVREATSNDPWGPSSSLMSEIADLTYNVVAFSEIMSMIWKRLNDHGKNWRHVYKVSAWPAAAAATAADPSGWAQNWGARTSPFLVAQRGWGSASSRKISVLSRDGDGRNVLGILSLGVFGEMACSQD